MIEKTSRRKLIKKMGAAGIVTLGAAGTASATRTTLTIDNGDQWTHDRSATYKLILNTTDVTALNSESDDDITTENGQTIIDGNIDDGGTDKYSIPEGATLEEYWYTGLQNMNLTLDGDLGTSDEDTFRVVGDSTARGEYLIGVAGSVYDDGRDNLEGNDVVNPVGLDGVEGILESNALDSFRIYGQFSSIVFKPSSEGTMKVQRLP